MKFLGQVKSSFIDYPGKICAVYFTGGCNFRCPYCHNSSLVKGEGENIDEEQVFAHLEKRRGMLDGVCISGGEPTLEPGLSSFFRKIKDKGFLAKLDTNGTAPEVLEELIGDRAIDYIAMDVKAPFGKYSKVAGKTVDVGAIKDSISIIKNSDVEYEFRTTVCKELLRIKDVLEIAQYIKGSKRYVVQNFRDCNSVLAGEGKFSPFSPGELEKLRTKLEGFFTEFKVR